MFRKLLSLNELAKLRRQGMGRSREPGPAFYAGVLAQRGPQARRGGVYRGKVAFRIRFEQHECERHVRLWVKAIHG